MYWWLGIVYFALGLRIALNHSRDYSPVGFKECVCDLLGTIFIATVWAPTYTLEFLWFEIIRGEEHR